jgi:hypothetical protein
MELRQRHWVKKVERWKESGMTKTEFCRQEGINRGTFATWWRRYKAQIVEDESGGLINSRKSYPRAQTRNGNGWQNFAKEQCRPRFAGVYRHRRPLFERTDAPIGQI